MSNSTLTVGGMFGDYRVVKLLGASGNVDVYLMKSSTTGRFYSMKLFMPPEGMTEENRSRFAATVDEAMGVSHSNIVQIYDFGEDPETGLYYVIMDYVDGMSLAEKLALHGAMSVDEAVRIGVVAARTLDAVHRAGLIHGDMKPENILFEQNGNLKIADLGAARASFFDSASFYTKEGEVIPPYTAPEQVTSRASVDARVDIFALGVILYEMLTGVKPAPVASMVEMIVKSTNNSLIPNVRKLRPEVPEKLADAIAKMCAPDREKRPQSAAEAADLLLAALPQDSREAAGSNKVDADLMTASGQKKRVVRIPKNMRAPNLTAVSHPEDDEEEKSGLGKLKALLFLMLLAVVGFGVFVAVTWPNVPGLGNFGGDKPQVPTDQPAPAGGAENDSKVRVAEIDGEKWYYTVENSRAILWRGSDDLHGDPCVEPMPSGRVVVPSEVGGYKVGGLGSLAFFGCQRVTEIVLPDTLETIGNRVFLHCIGLREMKFPPRVKSAGRWAFNQCRSMRKIDLANCASLSDNGGIFSFCQNLEEYIVGKNNPSFTAIDGALYSKDEKRLLAVPAKMDRFTIPDGVREIGEYAFCDSSVTSLKIPASVRKIGYEAFKNCHKLREIVFDGNAPELPDAGNIFEGASSTFCVMITKGTTGWTSKKSTELPKMWPKRGGRQVERIYNEVEREWRNTAGRARKATIVGITEDGSVIMLRNPGETKPRSCVVSRLSVSDRQFVSSIAPSLRLYKRSGDGYVEAE